MRARSLKPAIFKNELLAVVEPLYTLIFEGLWCLADREGKLEDRPAKIHFDVNPGRPFEGTQAALAWLAENGFIERYVVAGVAYIRIPNFLKHQRPHQNETPSVIPDPIGKTKAASPSPQGDKRFALTPSSLTPDSGPLTPDSLRSSSSQSLPSVLSEGVRGNGTIDKKAIRKAAVANLAHAVAKGMA